MSAPGSPQHPGIDPHDDRRTTDHRSEETTMSTARTSTFPTTAPDQAAVDQTTAFDAPAPRVDEPLPYGFGEWAPTPHQGLAGPTVTVMGAEDVAATRPPRSGSPVLAVAGALALAVAGWVVVGTPALSGAVLLVGAILIGVVVLLGAIFRP